MDLKLGDYNTLEVVKQVDFGVFLDGGIEGEVLLPAKSVPEGCKMGDKLEVFLYLDSEERLIATTERPYAKVGDFAYLEVAWTNRFGAFLKWGLLKDLFVPFREQKTPMEIGKSYMVYVMVDRQSYRVMATAKVEHHLSKEPVPYAAGDEVSVLVWAKTDLGYKVIIDNKYAGLVYDSDIFSRIQPGMRMQAYIKQVREDGKVDVALQPSGIGYAEDFSDTLLRKIVEAGGRMPFGDKSPAEDVYREFGVSKKVFKKAAGMLYKSRKIRIDDFSIEIFNGG